MGVVPSPRTMECLNIDETSLQVIRIMEKKINEPPKLLSKNAGNESCCIFRVPESLVKINKKAYQPHIVSIGPYHHGKEHLMMMQEHKWRFLGSLLHRIRGQNIILISLFQAIQDMEERIRECYSEAIEIGSHGLIEMMVLDGCFILELFYIVGGLVAEFNPNDPIFNMQWILSFIMRDLLRLENQIPFFVLETLFELSRSGLDRENLPSLPRFCLDFFNYMVQRPDEVLENHNNLNGRHLLDLFRISFIPPPEEETLRNSGLPQLIPSARKLHLAGIQFKPGKNDSFLDNKFNNGVLQIPLLTIDDFTSSVFLNCVAFEQCYNHRSNHMTTYATFMGCLINTPSDAGFLCDNKIIENYYGTDEEIARFFNNVRKDVAFDIEKSYLSNLFEDVNEYCRNDWHVRWAGFKHTYFDTPWSFISALAAIVLLIFTMIQAFLAIYAYVLPPNGLE